MIKKVWEIIFPSQRIKQPGSGHAFLHAYVLFDCSCSCLSQKCVFFLMLKASQFGMISFGCLPGASVGACFSSWARERQREWGMDFEIILLSMFDSQTPLQRRDQVSVWFWLGVCMRRFGTMPTRERERERELYNMNQDDMMCSISYYCIV